MTPAPLDSPDPLRSPPTRLNVGDVQIQQLPSGAVIVRKDYPSDRRRRGLKVVSVVSLILCLIPVLIWLMYSSAGRFAVLVAAFFAISIVPGMIRQFAAGTRSYVLQADFAGLNIEIISWRRRTARHFARHEVDDIVLGFSGSNQTQFKSWLVIKSSVGRNLHCLHDGEGDELARVANSLRAALGMPKRSWP